MGRASAQHPPELHDFHDRAGVCRAKCSLRPVRSLSARLPFALGLSRFIGSVQGGSEHTSVRETISQIQTNRDQRIQRATLLHGQFLPLGLEPVVFGDLTLLRAKEPALSSHLGRVRDSEINRGNSEKMRTHHAACSLLPLGRLPLRYTQTAHAHDSKCENPRARYSESALG